MPRHDYVALAIRGIRELLTSEHAVVWHEVEAKIGEATWPTLPVSIDPHHLSTARRILTNTGEIHEVTQTTRGGRPVSVVQPVDDTGRTRAISDASARKRLLQARYLGWASGSRTAGQGFIGPAAEAVVHATMRAAGQHGYRLVNPEGGQVRQLLGGAVPGGPLDNGAFLQAVDAATQTPQAQYVVLVEVKNIRPWIYPTSANLHQLLYKAGALQAAHPDRKFLPVLVCRRAQYLTTRMAQALGFYVIAMQRQYLPLDRVEPRRLDEVRSELGYRDLTPHEGSVDAMLRHFEVTLQQVADRTSERWAVTGPVLASYSARLRDSATSYLERAELLEALHVAMEEAHGEEQRWHSSTLDDASDD